jgi:SecD/SecF fusion protein
LQGFFIDFFIPIKWFNYIQVEDPDRIRVQLAGVKDPDEARKILSSQANLTIRDANDKVKLTGK